MAGGGVLRYFRTYVGWGHFLGFKTLNLIFFFWRIKILWIFFYHHYTLFRGHFYAFEGLFLKKRYRMGKFFWIAKISNIFWVLEISLNFYGVKGKCWTQAYV